MKIFLLLILLGGFVAQEPEPYPPGHVCVRPQDMRGPTDHACDCQRKCVSGEDENGGETITIQEDAQCKQFCHKDHCSCPVLDCP